MKIFKNKVAWLVPIAALTVMFIFSLTLIPSANSQPENLPIAIVNEDKGVEISGQPPLNMGETIVKLVESNMVTSSDDEAPIKWIKVSSAEEVQEGLNNQEYYAALIIPEDFSINQASLQTPEPSSPEIGIYINQGMNVAAASVTGEMLNRLVDNINNNMRTEIFSDLETRGATLTVAQAAALTDPITKSVNIVNGVGDSANGNAPVSLFQPLWMASIASAAIIFFATSKLSIRSRKESLGTKLGQVIIGAIAAFIVGFGLTWIADGMLGFDILQFSDTGFFLTLTFFSFFVMIIAVLSLLGIKGIVIFVLLLFFGAPLLALPPEMMPTFYSDWIYSWLPMQFMVEGLRELFFFGNELTWNTPVSVLFWIGIISMLVLFATALIQKNEQNEKNVGIK